MEHEQPGPPKQDELAALFQRLDALLDELLAMPNGRRAVLQLLQYILEVGTQADDLIVETAARHLTGKEHLVETTAEQLRRKGRQKGQQDLLLRQLTRRFGPLSAAAEARVMAAQPEELERLADEVLTAPSLEALLGV